MLILITCHERTENWSHRFQYISRPNEDDLNCLGTATVHQALSPCVGQALPLPVVVLARRSLATNEPLSPSLSLPHYCLHCSLPYLPRATF